MAAKPRTPKAAPPAISLVVTQTCQAFDMAIAQAIDTAKAAGLPQGFVVSVLHGHALMQTNSMVK